MDTSNAIVGIDDAMDPGKRYGTPGPTNRHKFICKFCAKVTSGGVYCIKQHLVGSFKNCKKFPVSGPSNDPKEVEQNSRTTEPSNVLELMTTMKMIMACDKRVASPHLRKPREKGLVDKFYANKPNNILKGRKGGKQQTINEVCRKTLGTRLVRI